MEQKQGNSANMPPLVSVLTTSYNRAHCLGETVESVLRSSFRDFELIVVDDCSTDESLAIANRYTSDPRVRVYRNERNLGDYPNRNRAASYATGKYLKYVDSDDVMYPHALDVMIRCMEDHPEAALGLSRVPSEEGPFPIQVSPMEAYRRHFLVRGLLTNGPSGAIIRADAFQKVGGFSGKRYVGDVELWLRLSARYPVVELPRGLVWLRHHEGQEFNIGMFDAGRLRMIYEVAREALLDPCCPLSPPECDRAITRLKWEFARSIWRLGLRYRRPRTAARLYKMSSLPFPTLLEGLIRRCRP